MQNNFATALKEFVLMRSDVRLEDEVEEKFNEEYEAVYKELKEKLGHNDGFRLYDQLSCSINSKIGLMQEAAYRRGFFDGIRLVVMAVREEE